MRKLLLLTCAFLVAMTSFGQAKKPTIMIVPSDVWCNQNGYMMTFDNMGTIQKIPDYKKALQTDANLLLVISTINNLMADRGFPLKNLESTLKSIEQRAAEDNMTTSKSGAELAESPLDRLKRIAKADIILQLTWTVNTTGPKKSITFNLQGLDAYTDKQIAGATGTGAPSFSTEIPVLLEEAILSHLDNFNARLQNHFDDLLTNGREVRIDIRVFDDGSGIDLETEFNGYELAEIIDEWMAENTVSGRYNKTDGSHNFIYFEQVRVPLFRPNGAAMDTEFFVRELSRHLRTKYNINSKVMTRGLGNAVLVIGEK
ncbi:MAG: DUF6175 family protein [Bacteroidetes bacterium]|nr:DUF6175 family protein [Bacteroidota bacterium]MCL2303345.1 DUF6175 family protein [Lentimicrobiaceae bacterium]